MKINDFHKLLKKEQPCLTGYEWFLEEIKGCKTAVDFFKKFENHPNQWHDSSLKRSIAFSIHGYLAWIFANCLDWSEFNQEGIYWYANEDVKKFLYKHYKVTDVREMTVKQLTESLIRAFS